MKKISQLVMIITMIASCALGMLACSSTHRMETNIANGKTALAQQQYKTAFEQLLPAAKAGRADAQYAIGYLYYYGLAVPRDENLALWWFNKAAKQDEPQAVVAIAALDAHAQQQAYHSDTPSSISS